MDPLYFASIWPGLFTLMAIPVFCMMDIKTRSISDKSLMLYGLGTIPATISLYLTGLPYTYALISLVVCTIWLVIRQTKAWGGGDTKFLIIFSIICPLNPLDPFQQTFQITFPAVLGIIMLTMAIFTGRRKDLPLMLPISVAIVIAMIAGAIL
jgi:hypothetical protein